MSEVRLIEGSDEEYYAIKGRLSPSGLKYLDIHPREYKRYEEEGVEVTQAMNTGKLMHSLLLEPETVKKQYTYLPKNRLPNQDKDFRDRENKEFKKKFYEDNQDKIVFDNEDSYLSLVNLAKSVYSNPTAKKLLDGVRVELGMLWTNFETNVDMRGKLDGFKQSDGKSRSYILDAKKFPDIHPNKVRRYLIDRFIPSQLAVYNDGLQEHGFGEMDDYYIFAIQEKPADFAIYNINQFIDEGWNEYIRLANIYKKCKEFDVWEGYEQYGDDDGIIQLTHFDKRELII